MCILIDNEINEEIKKLSIQSNNSIHILSGFCKKSAFNNLANAVNPNIDSKKLMVRFLLSDILSGASDLDIYSVAKEQNWELYINFDLHAKIYIFDEKFCILGSSNLTSKGLNLIKSGNIEAAKKFILQDTDFNKISYLFSKATKITDTIYNSMKEQIKKVESDGNKNVCWDSSIFNLFSKKINVLFTQDFPYKEFNMDEYTSISDYQLEQIKTDIKTSNSYLWLCNELISKPNKEAYFGELASKLHEVLIIEPRTFRKEAKAYLNLLLDWVSMLCVDEMAVDVPNYSTRVRLK